MYTFCCLIWKRDFSASYTCFVVEVPSLVLARRRRKIFERTLDFLHSPPQAKTILFFLGGVKMVPYRHFLHSLQQTKNFLFFLGQNGAIYTNYIHIFYRARRKRKNPGFFKVSSAIYTHFGGFFGGQNGAIYTNCGFFLGSKCCHIYTFWGVKMLPYIHISGI